jgi:hypothetical protein
MNNTLLHLDFTANRQIMQCHCTSLCIEKCPQLAGEGHLASILYAYNQYWPAKSVHQPRIRQPSPNLAAVLQIKQWLWAKEQPSSVSLCSV